MERVVLKIGTAVLNEAGEGAGASQNTSPQLKIEHIVGNIVPHLDDNSQQLVIVSSGAVGLGSQRLAFGQSRSLTETQICASVGQAQLIENYTKALARHGYSAAQILLTSSDLQNASRRKNVISCLQQMANQKVIPIVNENDVLSTEEIEPLRGGEANWFGDNDKLSCLLAIEIEATALVLLTTSSGIYKSRPKSHKDKPISLIEDLSDFDHVTIWQGSSQGRGGIASKIEAIKHAAKAKVPTWITSGSDFDGLSHFFKGFSKRSMPKTGTFVLAGEEPWKNS